MAEIVLAYDYEDEFLQLVKEYTDDIAQQGAEVVNCLATQNLSSELAHVEDKYGLPDGRMYIARVDGIAAGCVALTKNDDVFCEIKRLYVKPVFRGQGISKLLLETVVTEARKIGYKHMRLDTFPFMASAIKLYEKHGFYNIERYNGNFAPSAIFMQVDL